MRVFVYVAKAWESACARVILLMQNATHMRRIGIYSLSGSDIFFDIISETERFSKNSY